MCFDGVGQTVGMDKLFTERLVWDPRKREGVNEGGVVRFPP